MRITQKERIIKYINDFGSITGLEAMRDLGIQQLGARLFQLEEDGYKFIKKWETNKNRYGENVNYKRYYLDLEEKNEIHI